ncbi:hypothetical protein GCM10027589_06840 [Actinocorallia lasiicapitis]
MKLRELPARLATGAFMLRMGLDKWNGTDEQADGVHKMACTAYPFLKKIPASTFLRLVSVAEITTGTVLLVPLIPAAPAGAVLTAYSSGLFGMYLRTPSLRRPHSIWPSHSGMAVAQDSWLVGIGLGLLIDGVTSDREGSCCG